MTFKDLSVRAHDVVSFAILSRLRMNVAVLHRRPDCKLEFMTTNVLTTFSVSVAMFQEVLSRWCVSIPCSHKQATIRIGFGHGYHA